MPRKERDVLTLQCKLTEEEVGNADTEEVEEVSESQQQEG